jgi:hypothetical protein
VQEPTPEDPIRKYVPVFNDSQTSLKIVSESKFKPGFYRQGLDFLKILHGANDSSVCLASLTDALQAIQLAEQICGEI